MMKQNGYLRGLKRYDMPISHALQERCQGQCELCTEQPAVHEFLLSPRTESIPENQVAICDTCLNAMNDENQHEHWRCLEGSIWNAEPSVQALSYRLLHTISSNDWAQQILQSIEPDENVQQWALSAFDVADVHRDAYGNQLENGDNVVLTQALNVKGTSFSAAKGTVVKRIRLVPDNIEQIEGKVNEQVIVILTKYVKKG